MKVEKVDGKKVIRRTRREVYDLWIEALKSGKYKQGPGQLKKSINKRVTYCCLGVLCDLARKDGGPKWNGLPHREDSNTLRIDYEYDRSLEKISPDIKHFMGFDTTEEKMLMEMNDFASYTFKDIAEEIKKLRFRYCGE